MQQCVGSDKNYFEGDSMQINNIIKKVFSELVLLFNSRTLYLLANLLRSQSNVRKYTGLTALQNPIFSITLCRIGGRSISKKYVLCRINVVKNIKSLLLFIPQFIAMFCTKYTPL
jgi:hypothetical protein